jgi:hypothetical protein
MSDINPLNTTNPRRRKLAKITREQITELRIATGMAGMTLSDAVAEMILMVQAGIKTYRGDFDLYTASRIAAHIQEKYFSKKKRKK